MKTKYGIAKSAINKDLRDERLKQIKARSESKQTRWQRIKRLIHEADRIG